MKKILLFIFTFVFINFAYTVAFASHRGNFISQLETTLEALHHSRSAGSAHIMQTAQDSNPAPNIIANHMGTAGSYKEFIAQNEGNPVCLIIHADSGQHLFVADDTTLNNPGDFGVRTHKFSEARNRFYIHPDGKIQHINSGHFLFAANDKVVNGSGDFDVRAHNHGGESRNIWTFNDDGTIQHKDSGHFLFAANDKVVNGSGDFDVRTHYHGETRNRWLLIGQVHSIPDVRLTRAGMREVLWSEYTYNQGGTGTCASHAAAVALCYVHGLRELMPNFIHIQAYKRFHEFTGEDSEVPFRKPRGSKVKVGVSTKSALEAARDFGSFLLPEAGKTNMDRYPQGDPIPPNGCRYMFDRISDVKHHFPCGSTVQSIKAALAYYRVPVVVGCIATTKQGKKILLDIRQHWRALPKKEVAMGPTVSVSALTAKIKKTRHAFVIFGWNDHKNDGEFLTKNSWGEGSIWAKRTSGDGESLIPIEGGNAALPFEFADLYVYTIWVGVGQRAAESPL